MCGDCPFPPLLSPQRGTGCCPCPDPSCVAWCSPSSTAAAACRSRCSASGSWRWSTFPRPCRNRCRGSWRSWAPPAAAASASASWRYRCGSRGRPAGEPPGRGSSRTRRHLQQITQFGWTLGVPQGRDFVNEKMPGNGSEKAAMREPDQRVTLGWVLFTCLHSSRQQITSTSICWGYHHFLEEINFHRTQCNQETMIRTVWLAGLSHVRKPDPIYVTCLTGTGSDILCCLRQIIRFAYTIKLPTPGQR